MERLYKIGNSSKYGNIVAVSENLSIVDKESFFNDIDNSLKLFNLQEHEKEAKLIKNLKKGVSIGSNYYLIVDKRNN